MMMEEIKLLQANTFINYQQHATMFIMRVSLLKIQDLEGTQSNFVFKKFVSITIHFDKYDPTRAGRYIELPEWIKLKKGVYQHKK